MYTDKVVTYDPHNKISSATVTNKQVNIMFHHLTSDFVKGELDIAPDILSVRCETIPFASETPYMRQREFYRLDPNHNPTNIPNIQSKANTIVYNKEIYDLDSVTLPNLNIVNHIIAGITCHNKKYVYNGWIIENNSPCELMPFDWNVNSETHFCLNPYKCGLQFMKSEMNCYSFDQGERVLIYVKRSNGSTGLSPHSPSPVTLPDYLSYRSFRNNGSRDSQNSLSGSRESSYSSFISLGTPMTPISPAARRSPSTSTTSRTPRTPVTPTTMMDYDRGSRSSRNSNSYSPKTPKTPKTP